MINKDVKLFMDSLNVPEISSEELGFYLPRLNSIENIKVRILEVIFELKGFDSESLHKCTEIEMVTVILKTAKYLEKDYSTIAKTLLSNDTRGLVTYDFEYVFAIVSGNWLETIDIASEDMVKRMLDFIKPMVAQICLKPRRMILFNNESNDDEVALQVKDVVFDLLTIFIEVRR